MKIRNILLPLICSLPGCIAAEGLTWHSTHTPASYTVTKNADAVVHTAIKMWQGDMEMVTGSTPMADKDGIVRIIQLNRETSSVLNRMAKLGIPTDSLHGQNDGFWIGVRNGKLMVVGNNKRGTAYGVLELSRMAGISPWVWWSNSVPNKQSQLLIDSEYETMQIASVEYRGIFINDEDWTLQPWSWQTYEPGNPAGCMGAKTYRRVFELLMRLRANTIWPGMHGITTPFYLVPGAKEQADSCGIVIGTSHCEPLARNNVGEWDVSQRGNYNYVSNGEEVRRYWTERLRELKGIDNIFTIGMRGIHDGPMEGVKTQEEKTKWLQRAIDDQRELLRKHISKDIENIPQQFVPYKEVLAIMENGLSVPDDVMLTWCDDNYGYMTRLSDAVQQQRKGGGGIYYHLSYWGRPHDYMWLCCTQPGLIYNEMREAYRHAVRRLWVVNVHELKVAAYPLEFFLDLAWDIESIQPNTIMLHLADWLCREFGEEAGAKLFPAMHEYYRLTAIRRPEFMGWSQVEVDKGGAFKRRWSAVDDTEFSFDNFGDEADRYIDDWERVCHAVTDAESIVPQEKRDAFFSHIKYQVLAAAAMSTKMLEAQRARQIAAGNYNEARWRRDEHLLGACARSYGAYQDIRRLTHYWNEEIAGGEWRGTMCDNPRDLYVFYAPLLPVALLDKEVEMYRQIARPQATPLSKLQDGSFICRNAADYTEAGNGAETIQMLGHSMQAVSLPKGQILTYDIQTENEGDCTLYIGLIPTQPNDTGDLRFSVSIDDQKPQIFSLKEKFRSEQWKLNVLRAQALRKLELSLTRGKHTLKIQALDDHIIVDQWMIDFRNNRNFYVFPVLQ